MGKKPTFNSKTAAACDCHWLQRAAADPETPIEFDSELNEYHLIHGPRDQGKYMLYHCPCCGGAAPRSKRGLLFARIHYSESKRLHMLTKDLKTVDQVLAALGPPDTDGNPGETVEKMEVDGRPGMVEAFRTLVYSGKSTTALVCFTVLHTGEVKAVGFQGKYIGK